MVSGSRRADAVSVDAVRLFLHKQGQLGTFPLLLLTSLPLRSAGSCICSVLQDYCLSASIFI